MNDNKRYESWERQLDRKARLRIPASRLDYRPADVRMRDFEEACLGFTPETARLEASRCIQCPSPQACILACPLHNDIPSAMWEISEGNFLEAAAIYRQTSNFPELCGRLCPDEFLCAGSCGVGKMYPSVRLGRLEAYVADYQRDYKGFLIQEPLLQNGKRVAVVGSGPAGLTVAEELTIRGHTVTVFEMKSRPGGALVYSIPRFRLPLEIVEAKVNQMRQMGVEFVLDTQVGKDVTLEQIYKQGYQAVFLGNGAGLEDVSNMPGVDLKGVYQATDFLARTKLEAPGVLPLIGKRVAIFGGGHSAVDCARTAVRMEARQVTCYHRGSEMDMHSRQEDIVAAQEEGVEFICLLEPVKLGGDHKGNVNQVLCRRMRLDSRDPRSEPTPVENAFVSLEADIAVLAPERAPDPHFVKEVLGLEVNPEGWILTDKETGQTNRKGIFAAGDNTGKMHLAVLAIAKGRQIAANIHDFLM